MIKQKPFYSDGRGNKRGLAGYYQVSPRTVSNWVAWRIISGQMVSGEHIFKVAECDEPLFRYTREKNERR
ncbi:MAG: hypothetical protein NT154_04090 [Verrucomicrobia bacterium]|nr:hypothetical protein [Verrucomicrobiota bacterium]